MEKEQLISSTKHAADAVLHSLQHKTKPDLDSLNKWGDAMLKFDFNDRDATLLRDRGQDLENLLMKLTAEILNEAGNPIQTVRKFLTELTLFARSIDGEEDIIETQPFDEPVWPWGN